MNAAAFRHFYAYHFAANRTLVRLCSTALTPAQFTQALGYSHGAVRDQLVHLMNVEAVWFSDLRGVALPEQPAPAAFADAPALRAHWDTVEADLRAYLAALRDDMLLTQPIAAGEDKDLLLWQILLHVANHGTDHRAQLLRQLNDLGIKTPPQDYVFYAYEHAV